MSKKYWSVNSGKTWQRANAITCLLPDEYIIQFSQSSGLNKPNNISITVFKGQKQKVDASYTLNSQDYKLINIEGITDEITVNSSLVIDGLSDTIIIDE